MERKTIILLLVGSTIVTGFGIYLYKSSTSNNSDDDNGKDLPVENKKTNTKKSSVLSNFDLLLKNTGAPKPSNNILVVPFNDKKNNAQFYTNGRVFIIDNKTKKQVAVGNYSNGGKTIVIGSKNITSGSVFGNLLNTLNK